MLQKRSSGGKYDASSRFQSRNYLYAEAVGRLARLPFEAALQSTPIVYDNLDPIPASPVDSPVATVQPVKPLPDKPSTIQTVKPSPVRQSSSR